MLTTRTRFSCTSAGALAAVPVADAEVHPDLVAALLVGPAAQRQRGELGSVDREHEDVGRSLPSRDTLLEGDPGPHDLPG